MTSFILNIDVEPVRRLVRGVPQDWDGFPEMVAFLQARRDRLSAVSGAQVKFNWNLRMDPQIEHVYGDAGWVFDRYANEIKTVRASGDCIGLHVHTWRPGRRWFRGIWIADYEDEDWIKHCLRLGLETYKAHLGDGPAVMSFGDGFMHGVALPLMQEYGVRTDISMNPGVLAKSSVGKGETSKGMTPDYTKTPHLPFQPSTEDFRVPGATNYSVWEIPVTTGRVKDVKGDGESRTKLLFGMLTDRAAAIISQALERKAPYVLAECRTDVLTNTDNRNRFIEALAYVETLMTEGKLVPSTFDALCEELDAKGQLA